MLHFFKKFLQKVSFPLITKHCTTREVEKIDWYSRGVLKPHDPSSKTLGPRDFSFPSRAHGSLSVDVDDASRVVVTD
jgi:hypothetical protein